MKKKWKSCYKRITAALMAIALVFGMITVPARATENYSGVLKIEGAGWFSTQNTTNSSFYAQGTDTYVSNEGEDWVNNARKMQATDADSGVFIGNEKQTNGMLNKIIGNANGFTNIYQITGIEANAGDIVTIKGTFTTLDGTAQITFAESKFKWTGSTWEDCVEESTYEGTLKIEGAGWFATQNTTNNSFYAQGTDTYVSDGGEDWVNNARKMQAADGDSGIFVGTTKQSNGMLNKIIGTSGDFTNIYQVTGLTANAGDIVTIKGTFTTLDGTTQITFAESKFKWTGSTWEDFSVKEYSGKLTKAGAEGDGAYDANNWFTLLGTDEYAPAGNDAMKLKAAEDDAESGIFVGTADSLGEKQPNGIVKKYLSALNYYNVESIPAATAGTVITIKGTFYSLDGLAKVIFQESKFQYDGAKWIDYVESTSYQSTLTLDGTGWYGANANNTGTALYVHGTDTYLPEAGEAWNGDDRTLVADNADSGVFFGTEKQGNAKIVKLVGGVETAGATHIYFIEGFSASQGTVLTIKGNFTTVNGKAKIAFAESNFMFTGSAWVPYEEPVLPDEENRLLTLDTATNGGGDANGIFMLTDDGFAVDTTWGQSVLATADENSGVFLNDTKIPAVLKKYDNGKLYVGIVDAGITANDKDKVVIKGIFELEDYQVSYQEITLYYNGQVWAATYVEPVKTEYTDITLNKLHEASQYRAADHRWDLYITTNGTLPGEVDQIRFKDIKVTVDGVEHITGAFHAFDGNFFVVLEDTILPHDLTKDTKVIIKAGKYDSSDAAKGINIQEDYILYANRYGISDKEFLKPVVPAQTDVKLSIDREILYGGDGNGMYLLTEDKFPVDTTWKDSIRAVSYDDESGVFLNGEKIDAIVKKFEDGKIYVALADAGVQAKDKDKLEIKGIFALDDYAVSYASHTFYYNGKTWNTTYFEQKEEYTNVSGVHVSEVSWHDDKVGRWNIYIDVDTKLPGEIDKISFEGLEVIVDGKTVENSTVWHSHEGKLYVPISDEYLPKDAENGIEIVVKAGKAMGSDRVHGIVWMKDFTFYTFMGALTDEKPTTNTKYLEVSDISLFKTSTYREEWEVWQVFIAVAEPFETKPETIFYKLPIDINGKTYYVNAIQSGTNLYFDITKEMISPDAKNGVLTIKAGATAIANAGKNGVRINDTLKVYLFNRTWSEKQYTEVTMTDCKITGVQDSTFVTNEDGHSYTNVYVWTDTKMPGSAWYEAYLVPVLYNGQEITVQMERVVSMFGRLMYFGLTGTPKEGDIVTFKANTKAIAGGLGFTIKNDFSLIYKNGLWSEYVKSDVKAPADDKSLWDVARFDSEFIPYTKNGVVTYSNTDKYNVIRSMEPMKDYTISFTARKLEDNNEALPNFTLMLRANAIDEKTPISKTGLYGYILSFQYGQLSLFKNNENWELLDTYRLSYEPLEKDEKFFEFGVDYDYEVSIYNVTDTCVCITFSVNGVEQIRYYDHASDDPMDPVVNAGDFRIYADCTTSISDDVAKTDTVLVSADTCETNKGVYVAASYPYVAEDTELTVDGANATIEDGVFKATKAGTYTISGTYKGEPVASTTIVVTEAEKKDDVQDEVIYEEIVVINWPVVIALVAAVVAVGAGVIVFVVKKRKNGKSEVK